MKEIYKRMCAAAVIGFAAIILAAGILMYFEWRSYEEKMEILYVALEQLSQGKVPIDIVSGLLKGQSETNVIDAEQRLGNYGFHKNFANQYKKSLHNSWITTIVVCSLLYGGFLLWLHLENKIRNRQRKAELIWLQDRVTALRDSASDSFRDDSGNGTVLFDSKQVMLESYEEDLGRFMLELSALADSLSLFRQQAKREREEPKCL